MADSPERTTPQLARAYADAIVDLRVATGRLLLAASVLQDADPRERLMGGFGAEANGLRVKSAALADRIAQALDHIGESEGSDAL